jgi:hypothetical protein
MKLPQVQTMIRYSENMEKLRVLSSKNLLKYQLIIFISACRKTRGCGSDCEMATADRLARVERLNFDKNRCEILPPASGVPGRDLLFLKWVLDKLRIFGCYWD